MQFEESGRAFGDEALGTSPPPPQTKNKVRGMFGAESPNPKTLRPLRLPGAHKGARNSVGQGTWDLEVDPGKHPGFRVEGLGLRVCGEGRGVLVQV